MMEKAVATRGKESQPAALSPNRRSSTRTAQNAAVIQQNGAAAQRSPSASSPASRRDVWRSLQLSQANPQTQPRRGTEREARSQTLPGQGDFNQALAQSGPGSPLEPGVQRRMQAGFGQDFAGVRVHNDGAAAQAANEIGAQAFTLGRDIYFGRGRYQPQTQPGQRLLAHELAHVAQQRSAAAPEPGRLAPGSVISSATLTSSAAFIGSPVLIGSPALIGSPNDRYEREAEAAARRVVDGDGQAGTLTIDSANQIRRLELPSLGEIAAGAESALEGAIETGEGLLEQGEEAVSGALETAGEALDWLASEAGQAALEAANALAGLFGGSVVISGGCLIVTIPEIPLFPSFEKTLGETPPEGFFIPLIEGGIPAPIPVAGMFGILGYAQASVEAAVGPGVVRNIRLEICPFSSRYLATAQLYVAAAIGPRLTLFGGLAAVVGTIIPFDPPIPVIVIIQGGLRGTGTAWFIGALQDTVTLMYSGGTLSFDNVTDLMGGVLLQGDVDIFAALRLYEKIICQYVYPLGHWEAGRAWKLTIPIHAGYGSGGGTGGVGPITWGPMPIQDIVTNIHPLESGWNCLSWDEIERFLCENEILPPELCEEEEGEPALGIAGDCVANDNLSESADSFISRCRKASIRREFPSELLPETLGNIKKGKSARHKKAWKLLNDSRFKKPGAGAAPATTCPLPVKYHQTLGRDNGGGVLYFEYEWESNTGNLADLKDCEVGEQVSYPGKSPYVWPSPPWDGSSTPNPTVIWLPATLGKLGDTHSSKGFKKPYVEAGFTATQYYRYRCPCANGGSPINLMGPISIVRKVSKKPDGNYKYTITKSGVTASIDPLP